MKGFQQRWAPTSWFTLVAIFEPTTFSLGLTLGIHPRGGCFAAALGPCVFILYIGGEPRCAEHA